MRSERRFSPLLKIKNGDPLPLLVTHCVSLLRMRDEIDMDNMIELLLLPATVIAGKADSKANPESDGNDDDDNDKEAPPFELAGASG